MLVILAGSSDSAARELVVRWPNAALLTPRDLSGRGWRHQIGLDRKRRNVASEHAVISGETVSIDKILAVYTRLPSVFVHELTQIRIEDKEYVAAEMNAFLLSWLTSLPCHVVNRPSPLGLAGPNLRPEAWTLLAARASIPVRPVLRGSSGYQAYEMPCTYPVVAVVGRRCFGEADPIMRQRAQTLARTAGVDLLTATFDCRASDAPFVSAKPSADLEIPGVENAIFELLCAPLGNG